MKISMVLSCPHGPRDIIITQQEAVMSEKHTVIYGNYEHKSCAKRALKKRIGDQISISFETIPSEYETFVIVLPYMLQVIRNGNAWSVRMTADESDARCLIKGEDDNPKIALYSEVVRRQDNA
jgi:hypothetical protein